MDEASKLIYGGFPRTVGSKSDGMLRQHFVHSEAEFDLFFKKMRPDRNLYSSICRFRSDMRPVLGNVCFDFDSPMKESAFTEELSDRQKINRMRMDEDLTEEVLGEVWNDTQKLVKQCKKEGLPVISVFSGMGVHSHILYKDRVNPVQEKVSISQYLIDKCDLKTWDRQIITDTRRVLRIPNSQRVDAAGNVGVWMIPMTEDEVLNNSIHDVLARSSMPKKLENPERYKEEKRPEMGVRDGYEEVEEETQGTVPLQKNDISEDVPDDVEYIIRNCINLPCVKERFLQPNPHHMVRFNGVVHLYQVGFTPKELQEIIRKIGWVDYDEGITKKMTEQIWNRGYSENRCKKLQTFGLCVHGPEFDDYSDDPKDCDQNGWASGSCLWK